MKRLAIDLEKNKLESKMYLFIAKLKISKQIKNCWGIKTNKLPVKIANIHMKKLLDPTR